MRRGGKLILSGGWNNALVPAGAVLDYYNRVEATIGRENTRRAVRLYMVPGMIECNGGPGTDTFDMLGVMRRWVERGQAPNEVIASRVEHGKVVRTRPLCPYPQVATYRGQGKHGRREQISSASRHGFRMRLDCVAVTRVATRALLLSIGIGVALSRPGAARQQPVTERPSRPWTQARTAWGDPDLGGVWTSDNNFSVPLERPADVAGKEMFDGADLENALRARAKHDRGGGGRGRASAPARRIGTRT